MPRSKPMTDAELEAWESSSDLEAELIESVRQMKAGHTRAVYTPVVQARENLMMTQQMFAAMLGVSARTLQQWEQGRREPSGAAKTLVEIARLVPGAFVRAGIVAPSALPPKTSRAPKTNRRRAHKATKAHA